MDITVFIEHIGKRIIDGGALTLDEALTLYEECQESQLQLLLAAANRIREHFRKNRVDLCAITNAKSGNCSENCAFCAQSGHHGTAVPTYSFISVEEILKKAHKAYESKAHRFCIVTSGCSVSEGEFNDICLAIRRIKQRFPMLKMDASLGRLTRERAQQLKEAGLDRFNHNIETAPDFFDKVCTTHSFNDRLETIKILKEAGIEVCCGGIIGLGETHRQRLELAFFLKSLDVDCVPINFLNPIKGTPLENSQSDSPMELLKIIALFRLILPEKQIRVCGGREKNLRQLQPKIFFAGADAIIIGDYLTTKGSEPHADLQMIADAGLTIYSTSHNQ